MDKATLNKATSADDAPTPGFILEDILRASFTSSAACNDLEYYLSAKLARNDPNVKLKCLRLIKHVALQNPEFRRLFSKKSDLIRNHLQFTCTNDPLKGDYLPRSIREEAESALQAIFAVENTQVSSVAHRIQSVSSTPSNQIQQPSSIFDKMSFNVNLGGKSLQVGVGGVKDISSAAPSSHQHHGSGNFPNNVTLYASDPSVFNRPVPVIKADNEGELESKVIDTFCTPSGARTIPTSQALEAFFREVCAFSKSILAKLLVMKLQDPAELWQTKLKALYAVELLLTKDSAGLMPSSDNQSFAACLNSYNVKSALTEAHSVSTLQAKVKGVAALAGIDVSSLPAAATSVVNHTGQHVTHSPIDFFDEPSQEVRSSGRDLLDVSSAAMPVSQKAAPSVNPFSPASSVTQSSQPTSSNHLLSDLFSNPSAQTANSTSLFSGMALDTSPAIPVKIADSSNFFEGMTTTVTPTAPLTNHSANATRAASFFEETSSTADSGLAKNIHNNLSAPFTQPLQAAQNVQQQQQQLLILQQQQQQTFMQLMEVQQRQQALLSSGRMMMPEAQQSFMTLQQETQRLSELQRQQMALIQSLSMMQVTPFSTASNNTIFNSSPSLNQNTSNLAPLTSSKSQNVNANNDFKNLVNLLDM
eukprot:GDKK01044923.1.p1 GENE.GDKK01044923.1~~GDKK01044923.1.p1  ORF type:complete len:645 (-),score=177.29 GDKK01044923.1:326-2260(-)